MLSYTISDHMSGWGGELLRVGDREIARGRVLFLPRDFVCREKRNSTEHFDEGTTRVL